MMDEKNPSVLTQDHEEPVLIFTEGPAPQSVKPSRGFSAWLFCFAGAILTLAGLCFFKPDPYWTIIMFVPDGLLVTFKITLMSVACAVPIGLFTGLGRLSKNPFINAISSVYVEIIRGIPLLMQLFYIYFALGSLLQISPTVAAVTSLSLCYGAYMGEVFRAGILSISHGQTEAARSLGFTRHQTTFLIIIPQAMRTILPPIGNECIALLKDTSLVSVIAIADVLRRGREYSSATYEYFETYTVIALVYLIITLLLSKFMSMLERRLSAYDRSR